MSLDEVDSNPILKMLSDEVDSNPILNFTTYADYIVNLIRNSSPPKFSIGVFGEWGTGKTTLMKAIEHKLTIMMMGFQPHGLMHGDLRERRSTQQYHYC